MRKEPAVVTLITLAMLVALVLTTDHWSRQRQGTPTSALGAPARYLWALIGDGGAHLPEERRAGIRAQIARLSWRDFAPSEHRINAQYVARKRGELARLRQAGFAVILELGFHDTPAWVHTTYADSYYVDQYGDRYSGRGTIDSGDANLVFNPRLRTLVASYVRDVFNAFGTDFAAVRLGGGHWGELTYPAATYAGHTNCYWAFDRAALAASPTPRWSPGEPSPHEEAGRFLNWYLDMLVDFQNWQIIMLRQRYRGPLMVLYPSWGIRPGQIAAAVRGDLGGGTSAEVNGEIQGGLDFARQVHAVTDPGVIVTTTWLDADASGDTSGDQQKWSPIKYLSFLAEANPHRLQRFGENTGHGAGAAMTLSMTQMKRYGLSGMAWYRESELFSGRYATLDDYKRAISLTT